MMNGVPDRMFPINQTRHQIDEKFSSREYSLDSRQDIVCRTVIFVRKNIFVQSNFSWNSIRNSVIHIWDWKNASLYSFRHEHRQRGIHFRCLCSLFRQEIYAGSKFSWFFSKFSYIFTCQRKGYISLFVRTKIQKVDSSGWPYKTNF